MTQKHSKGSEQAFNYRNIYQRKTFEILDFNKGVKDIKWQLMPFNKLNASMKV